MSHVLLFLFAGRFGVADGVLDGEADEDAQGEDLEGQAGDGGVGGDFGIAGGEGREGAAAALEDEGEDVTGDEEPIVEFGREAGVGGAEVQNSITLIFVS